MAERRPLVLIDGRANNLPPADLISPIGDLYSGATRYNQGLTRRFALKMTTDSAGRVTVYLTSNGLASGAALFTQILSIQVSPIYNGTDPNLVPRFSIENLSTDLKTLTVRSSQIVSVLGLLNINFGGAGLTGYLTVEGLI